MLSATRRFEIPFMFICAVCLAPLPPPLPSKHTHVRAVCPAYIHTLLAKHARMGRVSSRPLCTLTRSNTPRRTTSGSMTKEMLPAGTFTSPTSLKPSRQGPCRGADRHVAHVAKVRGSAGRQSAHPGTIPASQPGSTPHTHTHSNRQTDSHYPPPQTPKNKTRQPAHPGPPAPQLYRTGTAAHPGLPLTCTVCAPPAHPGPPTPHLHCMCTAAVLFVPPPRPDLHHFSPVATVRGSPAKHQGSSMSGVQERLRLRLQTKTPGSGSGSGSG